MRLFDAVILSAALACGCVSTGEVPVPDDLEVGRESATSCAITAPTWATPADAPRVEACVDAYVRAFEAATSERVPPGIVVQVVDGTVVEPGFTYTGYYWYQPVWFISSAPRIPLRAIRVVWERDWMGRPRSADPLSTLPHELAHDRQARLGRPVDHDFDAVEQRIVDGDIGAGIRADLEGRP